MSGMEKLIVLSGALWLSAVAFIVYAWITQVRQQAVLRYIAARLARIEQAVAPSHDQASEAERTAPLSPTSHRAESVININKNEPISKYETVTLPNEIDINFVDQ